MLSEGAAMRGAFAQGSGTDVELGAALSNLHFVACAAPCTDFCGKRGAFAWSYTVSWQAQRFRMVHLEVAGAAI